MVAKVYVQHSYGIREITGYVPLDSLELTENAEEGSVGMSEIVVQDSDSGLDFVGHRRIWVVDTDAGSNPVLYHGYIADQAISRGPEPLGRIWRLSVTDTNTLLGRRIFTTTNAKRRAENDLTRVGFALAVITELSDTSTYVDSTAGVSMDAVDYRGQTLGDLVDDAAQTSGRNYFLMPTGATGSNTPTLAAWYSRDTSSLYPSTLQLSNDPSEIDETTTLALGEDTTLIRDPGRVFSGVYLPYDGGATYRHSSATASAFARRDFAAPSLNVKSASKAQARANRYLADLDEQDLRAATTIDVTPAQVNAFRPGMSVCVHATHLPSLSDDFRKCRILGRTVRQIAGGTRYQVDLDLSVGALCEYTGDAFAALLNPRSYTVGGNPLYLGCSNTGDNVTGLAGWYVTPTVGSMMAFEETAAPRNTIIVNRTMTGRIECRVRYSGVAGGGGASATISVTISTAGGVPGRVLTASRSYTGSEAFTLVIDESGVQVGRGARITLSGSLVNFAAGGWSITGNNTRFLRFGRGTFIWNNGTETWTGS